MANRITLEGYAPPDLIERLKMIHWMPCAPTGKNFLGISFADNVLADIGDYCLPFRHRITIGKIPQGGMVQIEGYSCDNLCRGVMGKWYTPLIAGCTLDDLPLDQIGNFTPYRMTIEII